jgi:hypothetical protein
MGNWIIAAAIGFVSIICIRRLIVWARYRGQRVITCPENRRPAGVALEAGRAAVLGSFRLSACSRWPEHAGCGQECLAQIQESPEACLVRRILTDWYHGKTCACCHRPFGEIEWAAQKPALILADKSTVEWSGIPAESLSETLQTALPVCFACHMANTLVRERPDLVTDRSRRITV